MCMCYCNDITGFRSSSSGVGIEVGSATTTVPSLEIIMNELVGVKVDLLTV